MQDGTIKCCVGRILYAFHSLLLAIKHKFTYIESYSSIGKELSDGELLQLSNTQKSILSEQDYFQIIRKKTALLFSVCTESGAISVNASEQQCSALRNFGEYLGICFQIQDDIFDYSENINIGKPIGNDIREGKVTLPLILALKNAPENETSEISKIIDNKDFTTDNIN
jgi:octaprenyl-diphosphate synthase